MKDMKKYLTIILAAVAVIAIVVCCVFGSQKGNLQKTVNDLQQQLETAKAEAEKTKAELEQQLTDAASAAESTRASLEKQMSDTEAELSSIRTALEGKSAELEATAAEAEAKKAELEQQISDNSEAAEAAKNRMENRVAELETEKAELENRLSQTEEVLKKTERALVAARSNACLIYVNGDWSVQNWGTADSEDGKVKVTPATVNGEGEYTVGLEFAEATAGLTFSAISINNGEENYPGCFIRINAVRVNGQSISVGKGYTTSEDGRNTRMYLYREWNGDQTMGARRYDGDMADISTMIVDRNAFEAVKRVEVDFSVLTVPIDQGTILFSNSNGSVQNWGIADSQDGSVKVEAAEIRGAGSGYRAKISFETPVTDMSMLALAVKHGEVTFPGYALTITRIWVNGERIEGIKGMKGYTSSDDGVETRMNIYNQGVGELPEDARSINGDLTGAAAVWVQPEDFSEVTSIEIEFGFWPAPVTDEEDKGAEA